MAQATTNREAANRMTPPEAAVSVTPDDANDLVPPSGYELPCKCLWIGSGGDLEVDMAEQGTGIVIKNVPSGYMYWGRFTRVRAALTTAQEIIAYW